MLIPTGQIRPLITECIGVCVPIPGRDSWPATDLRTRPNFGPYFLQGSLVNKRLIWNAFKYLLAVGLLTYVVWRNWSPTTEAGEPLPGLKDVWQAHIIQREPIHSDCLLLAATLGLAAVLLTI